jgi:hypothetical protein
MITVLSITVDSIAERPQLDDYDSFLSDEMKELNNHALNDTFINESTKSSSVFCM